ncbi:ORF6N domain-containing protein [Desulfonatronum thioautotrophicum]|uniref:ORF6N domain-containing protein n=1 Tax=Desulfonatronum thioautotrophicum TaxID=617001 RepID=UPI0005EB1676|nr:ORF6N domain-containing protein [Desulfonatronum thioautotrophicum]
MTDLVPVESITGKILVLRGMKVMLDRDLADLYGVETKLLKRQVRRNSDRFPDDFMFELTPEEVSNLRCHFGTSSWGGVRYNPMAFTEQGVAMLSSVLNSKRAIQVNIQIMRAFTRLRQMLATHEDLRRKIEDMESKYDEQFRVVFEALRQLLAVEEKAERRIGFVREDAQEFWGWGHGRAREIDLLIFRAS